MSKLFAVLATGMALSTGSNAQAADVLIPQHAKLLLKTSCAPEAFKEAAVTVFRAPAPSGKAPRNGKVAAPAIADLNNEGNVTLEVPTGTAGMGSIVVSCDKPFTGRLEGMWTLPEKGAQRAADAQLIMTFEIVETNAESPLH